MNYKESIVDDTLYVTPYNGTGMDYISDMLRYIEVTREKGLKKLVFFGSEIGMSDFQDIELIPKLDLSEILCENVSGLFVPMIFINGIKVFRTRDKNIIEDVINKNGYINIMKNNQNTQIYPENSYVDTHYITIISDKHNFKDSNGVVRTEQGDYAFSEGTILKVKEKY